LDELEKLQASGLPTWQAQVEGATREDTDALGDLAGRRGLGIDDWSGVNLMCSDCSNGILDPEHAHSPASSRAATLGMAGQHQDLRSTLREWLSSRPNLRLLDLQLLW